jgi:hypothetical protein
MQHLDEGTIHAWLDGELPAEEAEGVVRHVGECAECGALVAEARGVMAGASRIVAALDAGPAGAVPRAQRTRASRRPWYRFALTPARMSIAATIIVAAGVTLTVRRVSTDSDFNSSAKTVVAPAASKTAPPASPASAPASTASDSLATAGLPAPANAPKPVTLPSPAAPAPTAASAVAVVGQMSPSAAKVEQKTELDGAKGAAVKDAAANATVDSARGLAQPALEAQRAVAAGMARGGGQFKEVAAANTRDATTANGLVLDDCYHFEIDSTDWSGLLPSAIALSAGSAAPAPAAGGAGAQAAASAPRFANRTMVVAAENPVHAVTPNGRVDSLVVGGWKASGPQLVSVHLLANERRKAVTLLLTPTGSTAQVISNNRIDSVRVVRTTCPR